MKGGLDGENPSKSSEMSTAGWAYPRYLRRCCWHLTAEMAWGANSHWSRADPWIQLTSTGSGSSRYLREAYSARDSMPCSNQRAQFRVHGTRYRAGKRWADVSPCSVSCEIICFRGCYWYNAEAPIPVKSYMLKNFVRIYSPTSKSNMSASKRTLPSKVGVIRLSRISQAIAKAMFLQSAIMVDTLASNPPHKPSRRFSRPQVLPEPQAHRVPGAQ